MKKTKSDEEICNEILNKYAKRLSRIDKEIFEDVEKLAKAGKWPDQRAAMMLRAVHGGVLSSGYEKTIDILMPFGETQAAIFVKMFAEIAYGIVDEKFKKKEPKKPKLTLV